MAVPKGLLWERDPHTAAKHNLLRRYLAAWFPIMARQFRGAGITFLDGFAGPGEYTNSHVSSPVIAMEQASRPDVVGCGTPTRMIFVEQKAARADHLTQVLEGRFPSPSRPPTMKVLIRTGDCRDLYQPLLEESGAWSGPVFANLDGWGTDTPYEMVQRLAAQPSSEVLVTFGDRFLIRFADNQELSAGDRVFGSTDWRNVSGQPNPKAKQAFLLNLYRERLLQAGFPFVLTFEMVDEGGHPLFLFFGTTNVRAVEKFKDAMWEVDGIAGQRFRDPRDPDQLAFDISEPNLAPLARRFEYLLDAGPRDLESLALDALLQTIYKKTQAKPAIDQLVSQGIAVQITRGQSYKERTYALAPPTLFG
jgi:three-Cys-motif partner protein